jgi:hypothetical protein
LPCAAARHLLVIGGGPIGLEMAQAHRRLGCAVTVIEGARRWAAMTPRLAAVVLARLRAEGVEIIEGAAVDRSRARGRDHGAGPAGALTGTHLLVAVGGRCRRWTGWTWRRPASPMTAGRQGGRRPALGPTGASMPWAMRRAGCSSPMSRAITRAS